VHLPTGMTRSAAESAPLPHEADGVSSAPQSSAGSVLVVEDDAIQRQALTRLLRGEGYRVETVTNGEHAVQTFEAGAFDLVVTDLDMPGRSGIEFLRAIRERNPDVPVILLTGGPTLDTAILAIEHRATRYLIKPLDHRVFRHAARVSMHASRFVQARRELGDGAAGREPVDSGELRHHFERAVAQAFLVYQPIVRWSERRVYAHEALVRSREAGLEDPGALFDAAERLDRVQDIGRVVRSLSARSLLDSPDETLFVNLHTKDLADESLYDARAPLGAVASRVVLEITERARLEIVSEVPGRIRRLREMGYHVALDDLGAGYASLTSFAALEPDLVKLDMSLVRGIDRSTTKQRLVGSMIRVCLDLGIDVVGEGVERVEERDALLGLGCDLLQGFLFGRPDPAFSRLPP
jgi:EAL domain-containing protein (putative c-di-GMP-specific phosphodiesterase class I)/ActR/RegA family two-component response regulator